MCAEHLLIASLFLHEVLEKLWIAGLQLHFLTFTKLLAQIRPATEEKQFHFLWGQWYITSTNSQLWRSISWHQEGSHFYFQPCYSLFVQPDARKNRVTRPTWFTMWFSIPLPSPKVSFSLWTTKKIKSSSFGWSCLAKSLSRRWATPKRQIKITILKRKWFLQLFSGRRSTVNFWSC